MNKSDRPRIDSFGSPTWTLVHDEFLPLNTTLFYLLLKESWSWPKIPFCFNFKISPSYRTLSKALDMCNERLLTCNLLSKVVKISWVIDNSCLMQEQEPLETGLLFRDKFIGGELVKYVIKNKFLKCFNTKWMQRNWSIVLNIFLWLFLYFLFPIYKETHQ